MDAATLYMVTMLPNGEQKTSTKEFSTLRACEVQADLLRRRVPSHPKPPDNLKEVRCEAHRPIVMLVTCKWYGRSCYCLKLTSQQGCTAYQWIVHLKDRNRTARCFKWPLIMNTDSREGEQDGMDMFGQPGLKDPPR